MAALAPITDYATLAAAIPVWANRNDAEYADNVPLFIQRAEERLFRNLRCPGNETLSTWTASTLDNTKAIALPNDYLEARLIVYGTTLLERISDQRLVVLREAEPTPGKPKYFARVRDTLQFQPIAATNDDVHATYYQFQGPIAPAVTTWTRMLRIAPFAYLYGALAEGARFVRDANETAIWDDRYQEVFGTIMQQSMDNEVAGSTVVVSDIGGGW